MMQSGRIGNLPMKFNQSEMQLISKQEERAECPATVTEPISERK
jgi:hypothetical protein